MSYHSFFVILFLNIVILFKTYEKGRNFALRLLNIQ